MNNEIKEILDMFTKYKDDWYSVEYILKPKQCVALYDYITNLQEEKEKYKNVIDKIKELINHYAVEDEDYSKIYNQEEKDILELLEEVE